MLWLSWGSPYSIPQWFLAATILITWLNFRFGDRRLVPVRFYVIALVSVVACAALGLVLLYYPRTPVDDGDWGLGFAIIYLISNAIYGAAVLGVLGIVALVSRGHGEISPSGSIASARENHPTASADSN